ncbi:MAG: GspH/FimT family protein [Elusimicrobia bacterium]|nr:GspH/FimT family protein [Elusimicrobiota bacterium]
MKKINSKTSGFVLIELIIVGIIISILFAVSWPVLSRFYYSNILESASRDIVSTIVYARDMAVIKRLNYKLNINTIDNRYWLSVENDPSGSPGEYRGLDHSLGRKRILDEKIHIKELSSPSVVFQPDGTMEQFSLCLENNKGEKHVIKLSMAGNIKVVTSGNQ